MIDLKQKCILFLDAIEFRLEALEELKNSNIVDIKDKTGDHISQLKSLKYEMLSIIESS